MSGGASLFVGGFVCGAVVAVMLMAALTSAYVAGRRAAVAGRAEDGEP